MMKIFLRTPYNYDMNKAGDESGLDCSVEPSLTHQSFAEECDINTIVRKFGVTGELPSGVRMPTYGDFSGVHDFHTAVNAISLAHEAFDQMPAEVRARFHHDPGELVDFCSKADNRPEAIKLGLVAASMDQLVPTGTPVPVASPAASGSVPVAVAAPSNT